MKPEIIVVTVILVIIVINVHYSESFGIDGETESYYGLSITNVSIVPTNFGDKWGYTFFGLVFNPTKKTFDSVNVDGEFYDPSGKLVGLQTAEVVKSGPVTRRKGRIQTGICTN